MPHQGHERVTSFNPHQSLLPEPSSKFSAKFPQNAHFVLGIPMTQHSQAKGPLKVCTLLSSQFEFDALGARKGQLVLTASSSPRFSAPPSSQLVVLPPRCAPEQTRERRYDSLAFLSRACCVCNFNIPDADHKFPSSALPGTWPRSQSPAPPPRPAKTSLQLRGSSGEKRGGDRQQPPKQHPPERGGSSHVSHLPSLLATWLGLAPPAWRRSSARKNSPEAQALLRPR